MKSIDVDGDKISYDYEALNHGRKYGEGAFLDSGTTFIYVAADFYALLKQKFGNYCSGDRKRCGGMNNNLDCYAYDPAQYENDLQAFMKTFPVINFDVGAERLYKLHPEDYMVRLDESGDMRAATKPDYCVGIKTLKNMILGGVFWRNYDIQINKEKMTVGFVRADCGKSGKVTPHNQPPVENTETTETVTIF